MLVDQKQQIIASIHAILTPLLADTGLNPVITLERPRDPAHGDVACNIAMQLAKPLKKNPRELAQHIATELVGSGQSGLLASAEVAGPGFINLRLSDAARHAVVREVVQQGARYGHGSAGVGQSVIIEFVSANPTGPLHVGHGRQAALGDALSSLFASQGWQVTREFYYNDGGVQIANLTLSVQARARGLGPGDPLWPESAYNGDYIADIAQDFLAKKTVCASDGVPVTGSGDIDDAESVRQFAVAYLRNEQDIDMNAFGVKFDNYFLESSLYADGKVSAAVQALIDSGKTYEQDGALWLRTTDYGDDKDRVMRKSDGSFTYFVPDVAYHLVKWQRGFTKAINVQGGDHHSTVARVRAGVQAVGLGVAAGYPDYVLHKMVTVMRGGQEVKISKRAGSYVTVRDLIDWSGNGNPVKGRDAVRFFFISRKADTEFVFDIDVALSNSEDNPVYYVQYAHARICRVLEHFGEPESSLDTVDLSPLIESREVQLLAKLADYPDMLQRALGELGPHQVAFYLRELAGQLQGYYHDHKWLIDDVPTKLARLALVRAVRQVLANGLALLGVSAPNNM